MLASVPAEADSQTRQLRAALQGLGATPVAPITVLPMVRDHSVKPPALVQLTIGLTNSISATSAARHRSVDLKHRAADGRA